ncbi:hypothetical protein [Photobacterium damselae]|uniref:hypothetical protein n=1 Tax=Photobacterium damselae TaxID=38293 RepID=UPI0010FE7F2C|nr:hypothetical protein [Photobacterium damselae]TLS65618.1 hypothetical protein FD718_19670 [Photobacterium damselae subsp. damselae]
MTAIEELTKNTNEKIKSMFELLEKINTLQLIYPSEQFSHYHIEHNSFRFYESLIRNEDTIIYNSDEIWLSSIKIELSMDKRISPSVKIKLFNGDGDSFDKNPSKSDDEKYIFEFNINKSVKKVILSVDNTYSIKALSMLGCKLKDFNDIGTIINRLKSGILDSQDLISSQLDDVTNLKINTIKELENEITSNTEKLSTQAKRIKENQSLIDTSTNHLNEIENRITSYNKEIQTLTKHEYDLKQQNSDFELKLIEIKKAIDEYKLQRTSLKKENLDLTNKISNLKNDAKSYTDDFASYKKSIRDQNIFYYVITIIFISISLFIFHGIFYSSLNYIAIFSHSDKVNLIQLLISRTPLIFFNIAALTISGKIIFTFINKILDNNHQVSDIRKIEFLVKEAIDSVTDNQENDDYIKMKIASKIEVIKEYMLKNDLKITEDSHTKDLVNAIKAVIPHKE